MKIVKLLLLFLVAVPNVFAQSNYTTNSSAPPPSQGTCLAQSNTVAGNSTGTIKTDITWLQTFEDSTFEYRLAQVELCRVSGVLTGLRASVVKRVSST